MINKFKATCASCGKLVFPGQGDTEKIDGKWVTRHANNCSPTGVAIHRGSVSQTLKEPTPEPPQFDDIPDADYDALNASRPDPEDDLPF